MSNTQGVHTLQILFRVEPGCLGPQGASHIEGFCQYAQQHCGNLGAPYARWQVEPRFDKTLPEADFFVADKKLKREQAARYASALDQDLDALEEAFHGALADWIDAYMRGGSS